MHPRLVAPVPFTVVFHTQPARPTVRQALSQDGPVPPEVEALRRKVQSMGQRLSGLRAELQQERARLDVLRDHHDRALQAEGPLQLGAALVSFGCLFPVMAMMGLVIAAEAGAFGEDTEQVHAAVMGLALSAGVVALLMVCPSLLRYCYHDCRSGSAGDRRLAEGRYAHLNYQYLADKDTYERRQADLHHRERELPALRKATRDKLQALTGLSDAQVMEPLLDYLDPDEEPLRPFVPLPTRQVEIVELD